ncbi:hypothetical protein J6500_28565 [Bradyrhizobium sp. WSM 1704]|uniref:hypothetical protein n=1 Tax=Bradyrhizobium semiaridum TaxID=2821404 RepID=UPI001CE27311|nr:hypothetical protein [Bradyrhizobium semiaridum]MCA6125817.1 hypothetical protein [Bradyrhizobium semiaridum]
MFTGATLLGLLFLVDWYLPAAPLTETRNDIDRSVIRIHSRHKWPEAIRMDTSAPLVTAAAPVPIVVAAEASAPPAQPETPAHFQKPAQTGKQAQADESQATSRKARSTRQARYENRRRTATREAGQRVASYRTPDWFGWPSASW